MIGYEDYEWQIPIADSARADYTPLTTVLCTYNRDHNIFMRQRKLEVLMKENTKDGLAVNVLYDPTPVRLFNNSLIQKNSSYSSINSIIFFNK